MSQHASPLSDPAVKTNPYPYYAQVRNQTPAYKTTLPNNVEVYLVTRYADVIASVKDPRLVKNVRNARPPAWWEKLDIGGWGNNSNMLKADPPEHTRLRALAHEAFTPKYVNQLRGQIQQIADELLDKVQPQGHMDVIADYAFPLPITVISDLLGVPAKDHLKFREWSSALIASGALSAESPQLNAELFQMLYYMHNLIDEHRREPKDDLITQLLNAEKDGQRLSNREVLATAVLLLIAGHETTVNLIGNGTLALLENPEQLQKLKDNPALIKPAVEELLRFTNPVQIVNRFAAEDLEIGGVPIPKGSHVVLVIAAANHDSGYVPEPDQLDVTHADARHLAFSQGIHYCLGAPLARLEGEIAFATLLRRMPNIHLVVSPDSLRWRPAFELRGLESLPVEF